MFKKFIPFATAKSAYEIDKQFLKDAGIKVVFIDIDNTLDSYKQLTPNEAAINLINSFRQDFDVVVISNNHKDKVTNYASKLNVPFIYKAYKPIPKKINAYINMHYQDKNGIILIGDQMITDVWCAANAGIKVILTNKLVKEDQWTTHINRIFERIIKKHHTKRNNLVDWRDVWKKLKES